VADLDERAKARDVYETLLDAGDGWSLPAALRAEMTP